MSRGRVVVAGLGPAGPELVTAATLDAIRRIPDRYLRTVRHPSVDVAGDAASFDWVYEAEDDLEAVYARIVEALVLAAARDREVLYLVPGSPLVAERTVELLRADGRVDVEVLPALSFLDLAWARLGVDPLACGARLVDGHRFAVEAAGERGPLLVGQCDQRDVLSEIKLAVETPPREPVVVLQRLGLPDEHIVSVPWEDLDRAVEPDHLTSVWIPALAAPVGAELVGFEELVRTLRARCPWDREQTHQSLTRHLLEESYEVVEAISALDAETGAGVEALEEELGDLLYQVYFHATLAAEQGWFTLADVAAGIHAKLVRRHPHVFGGLEVDSTEALAGEWERQKRAEKGRTSVMDGIPGDLPALAYAAKVQRKARQAGFDAPTGTDVDAALAAWRDAPSAATLGALLAAVVALAREADLDAEVALRAATAVLRDRVREREASSG